jgi:acyl-CoA reductase-like NAD-dependent aldehyde dehydrogenase
MNKTIQKPKAILNDDFKMSIDGKLRAGKTSFEVYNPATNAVLAHAPEATRQDLDDAVAAAKMAFKTWSRLSWDERGAYITSFAEAIEARQDDLITMLTLEQGKPRHTGKLNWPSTG